MTKLLRVFLNADMRYGHRGLKKLAKDAGIDVSEITPGDFVIFLNTEKNRIKLYGANNVVAYLALDQGKIDMRTVALIPRAFKASGKIDYDASLKDVVMNELRRSKK